MKLKQKTLLIGVFAAIVIIHPIHSKATLQANKATHQSPVAKTGAAWMTEIRQMETTGQTMGLEATLEGVNETSQSNGLDVHMMLPTEYGAIAILSTSGYGNVGKLRDETDPQNRTTTGNATGVYFTGDRWEWGATDVRATESKYNSTSQAAIRQYTLDGGMARWKNNFRW